MQLSYSKIIKNATVSEKDTMLFDLRKEFAKEAICAAAQEEGQKILSEAKERADYLIGKAEKEAEKILAKTQERYENAYKEGYDRGYRDGYEIAYRDGMEKVESEAINIRNSAWEMLRNAEEQRNNTLSEVEKEVIALAIQIAEKLVVKQLDLSSETVLSIVQESLRLVADRDSFIVVANPIEVELIRQNKDSFVQLLAEGSGLKIIGDPDIKPGGCRVETERGKVDAALESRWQALVLSIYDKTGDEDE